MIILISSAWLLLGAPLAPVLRDPRRSRIMNTSLAVVLAGTTAAVVHQFLREGGLITEAPVRARFRQ